MLLIPASAGRLAFLASMARLQNTELTTVELMLGGSSRQTDMQKVWQDHACVSMNWLVRRRSVDFDNFFLQTKDRLDTHCMTLMISLSRAIVCRVGGIRCPRFSFRMGGSAC